MATHSLDQYLEAAQRENTQRSYASDIRHFEVTWGGLLPATAQTVANYLAAFAETLSISTLRRRLAALAQWHREHGFADPTGTAVVKKVLKGIRTLHPATPKQAEPLQLTAVSKIVTWLENAIDAAEAPADRGNELRYRRDKAILLLGFWRGFRADEIIHLQAQHVSVVPAQGMTLFLARSKGDRQATGTTYRVPALSRWCPVAATLDWLSASGITNGPLFRRIDQWGRMAPTGLHSNSVIPLLRRLFSQSGLPSPEAYSGHSLRRGFAGWASANGWDIKALMEYVGWKDIHSAMRYIDTPDSFGQQRIEEAIRSAPAALPWPLYDTKPVAQATVVPSFTLVLSLLLTPKHKGKTSSKLRKTIESICLSPYQAIALNRERSKYTLAVEADDEVMLNEIASSLIEDLYRIAGNHDHDLDASLYDEVNDRHWV